MAKAIKYSYEELVEKAQNLFWLKGYKGVSVNELANHLNVSTSIIYNKYSKDILFLDSLDYYTSNYSDPFLSQLRETTEGLDSLKAFFYSLIDALLDKTFPKSCLMVNTVVEMRNENQEIIDRYNAYFKILTDSYKVVLEKAFALGQIKDRSKIEDYSEFLLGVIFGLSILYKIQDKPSLQLFVDGQLSFIK